MIKTKGPYDIAIYFERFKRFCVVNIRWITRSVFFILTVLLLLHAFYAPSVEWVGKAIHLADPSLAAILALVVGVWVFERVLVLHELIKFPSISISDTRIKAYNRLSELVKHRRVNNVDLIQVSGHTSLRFLRDLAETKPTVQVRLLLLHESLAKKFDTDDKVDHCNRIKTTVAEVKIIESDFKGFRVTTKYYKTPPGIAAIIIEPRIISVSWYTIYRDIEPPNVDRVRGHLAPTVIAIDDQAEPFISFAAEQFERVWSTAEDHFS